MSDINILKLPKFVLYIIIKNLDLMDIGNILAKPGSQINKYFNSLNKDEFWNFLLKIHYPTYIDIKNISRKDMYKILSRKCTIYNYHLSSLRDEFIIKNIRCVYGRYVYPNQKVNCDYIDEFNIIMSHINPESFQRDIYREKYLIDNISNTKLLFFIMIRMKII